VLLAQVVFGGVPSPLVMIGLPEILLFPLVVSHISLLSLFGLLPTLPPLAPLAPLVPLVPLAPLPPLPTLPPLPPLPTLPPLFAPSRALGGSPLSRLIADFVSTSMVTISSGVAVIVAILSILSPRKPFHSSFLWIPQRR